MMNRKSRSRVRHRRAHWKATAPLLGKCPNAACGLPTPPHAACAHCGMYKGRQVLPPS
ncbi:50S ribosomal protein L32 [Streptomyces sp. NPDC046988]|uniref:50S ribosomal protein L32 n=1 Tax=Streptomyces sp. NPDC046988 TaxID=3154922 RepID=UPI0033E77AD6